MIQRGIKYYYLDEEWFNKFDFFNDYKDTLNWLDCDNVSNQDYIIALKNAYKNRIK